MKYRSIGNAAISQPDTYPETNINTGVAPAMYLSFLVASMANFFWPLTFG